MRQGFTVHHNGPPAECVGQGHSRCERFWAGVKNWHINGNGWSDIAYSFGICPHGIRFTGRGWVKSQFANGDDEVGADDDINGPWYSVLMFVGGGPGTGDPEEKPTAAMDHGLDLLITEGRRSGRCGMRVKPHSDWKRKPCPGPHYYTYCRTWDNQDIVRDPPMKEWDEMASKAEVKEALAEVLDVYANDQSGAPRPTGMIPGEISARLVRDLSAPSSALYQALTELVGKVVDDKLASFTPTE